ncbi:MAG TPA: DUF6328 family protein [Pirellulales bacterium]|nr:DUF6328 family protein [Pirellulales bacterium]
MTKLKVKMFFAYNETNILRLGAQLLLGIQLQETLGADFRKLPHHSQYLHAGATTVMLLGLGLLIAPSAYHRIVDKGAPSENLRTFTSRIISLAIVPFVLGLGVEFDIILTKVASTELGVISAVVVMAVGFALLYGWFLRGRANAPAMQAYKERSAMKENDSEDRNAGASMNEKVMYALMETQMILPGVQVLIGFQGGAAMSEGFNDLPAVSKTVYVISLALLSLTMLLLMMPVSYHRYVEQGEATENFLEFTSRVLVWSMIPFGIGMCGNLFVVLFKVSGSLLIAASGSAAMSLTFYCLWFGYTMRCRRQCRAEAG